MQLNRQLLIAIAVLAFGLVLLTNDSFSWNSGGVLLNPPGNLAATQEVGMVSDQSNGAVVVWSAVDGSENIYAKRINETGETIWGPLNISGSDNLRQWKPRIAINDFADFAWIIWYENAAGGGNVNIRWAKLDITTGAATLGIQVTNVPIVEEDATIVPVEEEAELPGAPGDPNAYIVWSDYRTGSRQIYAQKAWGPWAGNGLPISPTGHSITSGFAAAPSEDGGLFLAWVNSNSQRAFIQSVKSTGVLRFGTSGIQLPGNTSQSEPFVHSDDDGGVYVTWVDGGHIQLQRYDANGHSHGESGASWPGGGVQLCNANSVQASPRISIIGATKGWFDPNAFLPKIVVVAWKDSRGGIWARGAEETNGSLQWGGERQWATELGAGNWFRLARVDGGTLLAWQYSDNVYASQEFDRTGSLATVTCPTQGIVTTPRYLTSSNVQKPPALISDTEGAPVLAWLIGTPNPTNIQVDRQIFYACIPTYDTCFNVVGPHSPTDITNGAVAYVYYGNGHAQLTKPVIVVEGFDFLDIYNWPQLYKRMEGTLCLLTLLHNNGLDVVVVNWDNPWATIEDNATVLQSVIEYVNSHKAVGSDKNIVVGASMGGVIARLALTRMDSPAQAPAHDTKLYISFDSPHRGANAPTGLALAFEEILYICGHSYKRPLVQKLWNALRSPASKELLIYDPATSEPGGVGQSNITLARSPLFDSLRNNLVNANPSSGGYPQHLRKVAVANGGTVDQGYSPGDLIVSLSGSKRVFGSLLGQGSAHAYVWASPGYGASHKLLEIVVHKEGVLGTPLGTDPCDDQVNKYLASTTGVVNLDHVPGGNFKISTFIASSLPPELASDSAMLRQFCFVPTISALDLQQATPDYFNVDPSTSPFDQVYYATDGNNHGHVSTNYQQVFDDLACEILGPSTITGRVTDGTSGIAGVTIALRPDGSPCWTPQTTTDGNGYYCITVAHNASGKLTAIPSGSHIALSPLDYSYASLEGAGMTANFVIRAVNVWSDVPLTEGVPVDVQSCSLNLDTSDQYAPGSRSLVSTADGTGGMIVAWYGARGTSGMSSVYVQRFNNTGHVMWPAEGVCLGDAGPNDTGRLVIVPAGAGKAIVAWTNSQDYIRVRGVDQNGVPQELTHEINEPVFTPWLTGQKGFDAVSDGSGGAIIAWVTHTADNQLHMTRVLFGGQCGSDDYCGPGLYYRAAYHAWSVRMVSDATGFIVVWQHDETASSGSPKKLHAWRYNFDFSPTPNTNWFNELVVTNGLDLFYDYSVCSDGSSGAIIVFPYGPNYYLRAQKMTSGQQRPWGDTGVQVAPVVGYSPGIASDGSGGAYLTWVAYSGSNSDVYIQRLQPNGISSWISPIAVSNNPSLEKEPKIAISSDQCALVTWADKRASNWDIYAEKVSGSGQAMWSAPGTGLAVTQGLENQTRQVIVPDQAGGAIFAWRSEHGEGENVYAMRRASGFEPPIISNAAAYSDSAMGAGANAVYFYFQHKFNVSWTTNVPASSRVEYRKSGEDWTSTQETSSMGLTHFISIPADQNTTYDIRPVSRVNGWSSTINEPLHVHTKPALVSVTHFDPLTDFHQSLEEDDNGIYVQAEMSFQTDIGSHCSINIRKHQSSPVSFGSSEFYSAYDPTHDSHNHIIDKIYTSGNNWTRLAYNTTYDMVISTWEEGQSASSPDAGQYPDGYNWYTATVCYFQFKTVRSDGSGGHEPQFTIADALLMKTELLPSSPNPVRAYSATIRYSLAEPRPVRLRIYDLQGRLVKTLANDAEQPGLHEIIWDTRGSSGERVTPGIYFYSFEAGEFVETRKMVLLR